VIKEYLLFISKEEVKHEKQFKKILEEKGIRKYGWENKPGLHKFIDKNFKQGLLPKLNEILENFPKGEDIKNALRFAKKCEEQSIEFYGILRTNCDDIETKTLLIDSECEGKAHLFYIQQLISNYPGAN
jgi:rubrerythrin